jgi:hypothetical protein
MDPRELIGPAGPYGYPAPFWFIELFKTLGFALHAVAMNLWFGGIIVAMLFAAFGSRHAKTASRRLASQMPIIIAVGVNLGIVPLLFMQLAYYRVFYPATILMAWPWFAVIALLTVAYYGMYAHATGFREGGAGMTRVKMLGGWAAAILFIAIGFIFANAMSLMANVGAWQGIWERTNVAGAVLGIGLNIGDPSMWARWLMMFGLALTTVAAYIAADSGWCAARESDEYRKAAPMIALKLATVGVVWFALAGSWYAFGTWPKPVYDVMFDGWHAVLTGLTAIAIGLPWLLIAAWAIRRKPLSRPGAFLIGLTQFGAIGLNAISRQIKQNLDIARHLDLATEPVHIEWSPLILFLVLFVATLAVVVWILMKVAGSNRRGSATSTR